MYKLYKNIQYETLLKHFKEEFIHMRGGAKTVDNSICIISYDVIFIYKKHQGGIGMFFFLKGHTTDFFYFTPGKLLSSRIRNWNFFLILTTFRPPPRRKKVPKNVFLTIMIAKNTFSQGQGGV